MFNRDHFSRAIARSKAKQKAQVHVTKTHAAVKQPEHVAATTTILSPQDADEHEQYRQRIISKAIAHIRLKRAE